jgi:hypothetical protein
MFLKYFGENKKYTRKVTSGSIATFLRPELGGASFVPTS